MATARVRWLKKVQTLRAWPVGQRQRQTRWNHSLPAPDYPGRIPGSGEGGLARTAGTC